LISSIISMRPSRVDGIWIGLCSQHHDAGGCHGKELSPPEVWKTSMQLA
jgi:hypothetical protein